MSGLDSIAMAVALLEERQCRKAPEPTGAIAMPGRAPMVKIVSSELSPEKKTETPTPTTATEQTIVSVRCRDENEGTDPRCCAKSTDATLEIYDTNYLFAYIFSLDLSELATIPIPDPLEVIHFPNENDILCGRGGETNNHRGNIKYRQYVKSCQAAYIDCKRRDKPYIAQRIVLAVRKSGGRFLKKDKDTGTWRDVGNNKAREKTSQALREGAPDLRDMADSVDASTTKPYVTSTKKAEPIKRMSTANHYPTLVLSSPASASKRLCTTVMLPPYGCCPSTGKMDNIPSPTVPRMITTVLSNDQESVTSLNSNDAFPNLSECHKGGPRIKLLKKRLEGQVA